MIANCTVTDRVPLCLFCCLIVVATLLGSFGGGRIGAEIDKPATSVDNAPELAPFVTTPMHIVRGMLDLAKVRRDDVLYDLGSGDGRIVITAAKEYGARAVGFEIDPALVEESRQSAREARVEHLVEIRQQDIMKADFSGATVVTVYLFPAANLLLKPILRGQLKPGARVVSSQFDMGDWEPDGSIDILANANDSGRGDPGFDEGDELPDVEPEYYTIYLWHIAAKANH